MLQEEGTRDALCKNMVILLDFAIEAIYMTLM
jgi:hypothetical protein